MKIILGLLLAITLVGCNDQYRYYCQDPANQSAEQCKRPFCAYSGTCPDQLIKPEDLKDVK